jgi:predicted nucleic acid-binding protein
MIVLDTNVLSEAMSLSPNPSVYRWLSQQAKDEVYTTAISMAEILQGIELLPAGKRRAGLLAAAQLMFTTLLTGRVLPFDEAAAQAFAPIAVDRRKRGKPISLFDAQIASIAKARNAALATRDTRDFEGCGVRLVDPWQE